MTSPVEGESGEPLSFSVRTTSDRRRMSRAEAIELFSGLGDAPYVSASLGGCVIGDDAAVVVAEQLIKLSGFRSLTRLSLADCCATLSDPEAVRALSIMITAAADCPEISSVDLSANALGPMGVTACAALFQSRRHCLRNLCMRKAGIGPDAMKLLRSFVATRGPSHIEVLHLDENALSPQGVDYVADVIQVSPRLKDLSLGNVCADSESLLAILTALAAHVSTLESLNLLGNVCDGKVALVFANVFCANTKLRKLVLRNTGLVENAAGLIIRAIASSPIPIQVLDLGCNELGASCAGPLASCVKHKATTLQTLMLDDNEFGDVGAVRFMGKLEGCNRAALRTVSFAQNALSDVGAIAIATSIAPMKNIELLDLSGNVLRLPCLNALRSVFGDHLIADETSLQEREVAMEQDPTVDPKEYDDPKMKAALTRLARAAERRESVNSSALNESYSETVTTGRTTSSAIRPADVASKCSDDETSGGVSQSSSAVFLTPARAKSETRIDAELLMNHPGRVSAALSSDAVVSSARELRAQVNSLDMEVSNLVEELQAERRTLENMDSFQFESRSVRPAPQHQAGFGKSLLSQFVDIVWAVVLAAFVLMILFSIVQSQDELTFSLKPI